MVFICVDIDAFAYLLFRHFSSAGGGTRVRKCRT